MLTMPKSLALARRRGRSAGAAGAAAGDEHDDGDAVGGSSADDLGNVKDSDGSFMRDDDEGEQAM